MRCVGVGACVRFASAASALVENNNATLLRIKESPCILITTGTGPPREDRVRERRSGCRIPHSKFRARRRPKDNPNYTAQSKEKASQRFVVSLRATPGY